jgi:hypothetical protein
MSPFHTTWYLYVSIGHRTGSIYSIWRGRRGRVLAVTQYLHKYKSECVNLFTRLDTFICMWLGIGRVDLQSVHWRRRAAPNIFYAPSWMSWILSHDLISFSVSIGLDQRPWHIRSGEGVGGRVLRHPYLQVQVRMSSILSHDPIIHVSISMDRSDLAIRSGDMSRSFLRHPISSQVQVGMSNFSRLDIIHMYRFSGIGPG